MTVTAPPAGVASSALPSRLVSTWVIRSGSTCTGRACVGVDGQRDVRVVELRGEPGGRAAGEVGQVRVDRMQVQTLFLRPGQAGQVVGEPVQPAEFLAERGEDVRARG